MTLYTNCNHCEKKHKVKSYYSTRVNFKMYEGDTYIACCKSCSKTINRNVNEIYATYSVYTFATIIILSIIGTIYAYAVAFNYTPDFTPSEYYRPWYALPIFPIIIILIYHSSEKSKIRTFNRVRV